MTGAVRGQLVGAVRIVAPYSQRGDAALLERRGEVLGVLDVHSEGDSLPVLGIVEPAFDNQRVAVRSIDGP